MKKVILLFFIIFFYAYKCGPNEDINITVSSGTIPVYSWDGGSVHYLVVREIDRGVVVWAIETPEKDGINSPVEHGSIPKGCELILDQGKLGSPIDTTAFDKPLENGKKYKIGILRLFSGYVFGEKIFMP
ncbi:hypothetical protein ACFL4T_08885 [candidate division KSB1 bacterium]